MPDEKKAERNMETRQETNINDRRKPFEEGKRERRNSLVLLHACVPFFDDCLKPAHALRVYISFLFVYRGLLSSFRIPSIKLFCLSTINRCHWFI